MMYYNDTGIYRKFIYTPRSGSRLLERRCHHTCGVARMDLQNGSHLLVSDAPALEWEATPRFKRKKAGLVANEIAAEMGGYAWVEKTTVGLMVPRCHILGAAQFMASAMNWALSPEIMGKIVECGAGHLRYEPEAQCKWQLVSLTGLKEPPQFYFHVDTYGRGGIYVLPEQGSTLCVARSRKVARLFPLPLPEEEREAAETNLTEWAGEPIDDLLDLIPKDGVSQEIAKKFLEEAGACASGVEDALQDLPDWLSRKQIGEIYHRSEWRSYIRDALRLHVEAAPTAK